MLSELLLASGTVLGLMHGYRLLVLPMLVSAFSLDEATTSLVRRSGIVLCLLVAYALYARLIERRRLRELSELRPAPLLIAAGALSGALLIALCLLPLYALGAYQIDVYRGWQPGLLNVAALILIAAMLEEVVFRGLLFRILERHLGTWWALALSSLLFSAQHIGNIDGDAGAVSALVTVVTVALLGALWALVFVLARNLWVVIAHHAAWNFTILLAGVPLSGIEDWRAQAPLQTLDKGPDWLTGGAFGPEQSLLTLTAVTVAVLALARLARRHQRVSAPTPLASTA